MASFLGSLANHDGYTRQISRSLLRKTRVSVYSDHEANADILGHHSKELRSVEADLQLPQVLVDLKLSGRVRSEVTRVLFGPRNSAFRGRRPVHGAGFQIAEYEFTGLARVHGVAAELLAAFCSSSPFSVATSAIPSSARTAGFPTAAGKRRAANAASSAIEKKPLTPRCFEALSKSMVSLHSSTGIDERVTSRISGHTMTSASENLEFTLPAISRNHHRNG